VRVYINLILTPLECTTATWCHLLSLGQPNGVKGAAVLKRIKAHYQACGGAFFGRIRRVVIWPAAKGIGRNRWIRRARKVNAETIGRCGVAGADPYVARKGKSCDHQASIEIVKNDCGAHAMTGQIGSRLGNGKITIGGGVRDIGFQSAATAGEPFARQVRGHTAITAPAYRQDSRRVRIEIEDIRTAIGCVGIYGNEAENNERYILEKNLSFISVDDSKDDYTLL
jgi:hypothetical protein